MSNWFPIANQKRIIDFMGIIVGIGLLFLTRAEKLRQKNKFIILWEKIVSFQNSLFEQLDANAKQFYFHQLKQLKRYGRLQCIVSIGYTAMM